MMINFLSLSDLHISKKTLKDVDIVLNALWDDLKDIKKKINYIIITGDLINDGSLGFEQEYQYELLEEHFFAPLLRLTGLTKNEVFIVPGNHEVNRSKINKFLDENITDKFNRRDELNEFVDNIKSYDNLFGRLEDYNIFLDAFYNKNQYLINRNKLYSTYSIPQSEFKIGIACLNSAWGSYGGDGDYGKLLIGERQIDNALNDIKSCDLKIAMIHHPFEYLKPFDQQDMSNKLIYDFDIILTGHTHNQNFSQVIHNTCKTVFIRNGALYNGRLYNGYSIIEYDNLTKDIDIFLREYFDKRRAFDKAISIIPDGHAKYSLSDDEIFQLKKKNFHIIRKMSDKLCEDLNSMLITSISADTAAPKEISKIFVSPFLAERPEGYSDPDQESKNKYSIDQILSSKDNILFIGKKEIGKTTLLNYICESCVFNYSLNAQIPVIINFSNLPKGINIFQKAINTYLNNYEVIDFDLEQNLLNGNILILIDNLNIKDRKNMDRLRTFCSKYNKNRFILCMNENLLETVKIEKMPDIGLKYKTLYMYSFKRGQIRELVGKWFINSNVDEDIILNKTMSSLREICIPQTPLMVSLLLWIIEKQSNFTPINEASLVEKFIETLLEKLNFNEITYEAMDYTNKLDYLAHLSHVMVKNNKFYFNTSELYVETEKYFTKKGFEVNYENFVKLFFEKGILISIENRIYFRFTCFLEFFIAKYMSIEKNKEFRDFILSEDQYLKYKNEIVYFTGLNRQDYKTLKLIEERLIKSFDSIDNIVDIDKILSIKTARMLTDLITGNKVSKEELKKLRLSNKEKDSLLENPSMKNENNYVVNKKQDWSFKESFVDNLELYAKIIKNSELLDVEEKTPMVSLCVDKYSKLIGLLYKILFEVILDIKKDAKNNDHSGEEEENEEEGFEQLRYIFTIGLPIVMQYYMLENLGSPKLKISLEELISKSKNLFQKFMLICLYGDMKLPQYFQKFQGLINESSSALIQELIMMKLLIYNAMFATNDYETEQIQNLIASLKAKKDKSKNKYSGGKKIVKKLEDKSILIESQRQDRLIEKLKNVNK